MTHPSLNAQVAPLVQNLIDNADALRVGVSKGSLGETLIDLGGTGLRARITRKTVAELGLAPGTPVYAIIKAVTFDRKSLAAATAWPAASRLLKTPWPARLFLT